MHGFEESELELLRVILGSIIIRIQAWWRDVQEWWNDWVSIISGEE